MGGGRLRTGRVVTEAMRGSLEGDRRGDCRDRGLPRQSCGGGEVDAGGEVNSVVAEGKGVPGAEPAVEEGAAASAAGAEEAAGG